MREKTVLKSLIVCTDQKHRTTDEELEYKFVFITLVDFLERRAGVGDGTSVNGLGKG